MEINRSLWAGAKIEKIVILELRLGEVGLTRTAVKLGQRAEHIFEHVQQ